MTSTYIFNNNIKSNGANAIEVAKSNKVYIHGNTINNNKKNGIVFKKLSTALIMVQDLKMFISPKIQSPKMKRMLF